MNIIHVELIIVTVGVIIIPTIMWVTKMFSHALVQQRMSLTKDIANMVDLKYQTIETRLTKMEADTRHLETVSNLRLNQLRSALAQVQRFLAKKQDFVGQSLDISEVDNE